jgi:Aspartyl protease
MSISIAYDNQHAWKSAGTWNKNRPYSSVNVRPAGKTTGPCVTLWGLCDTGADYLCVEPSVAATLGINLKNATMSKPIATASGTLPPAPIVLVSLEMEGYFADVEALFHSTFTKSKVLVGRCALIGVLKFGVDVNGWLYAKA